MEQKPSSGTEFQENMEILREVPVLSGIGFEPLKVLAYLATREKLKAGEVLVEGGDVNCPACYVISGGFTAHHGGDGDQGLVASFGPGGFFGSLGVIGREPGLFTLRASEDTVFLTITREKFAKTLEQFPEAAIRILANLAEGVVRSERKFVEAMPTGAKPIGVSLL